MKRIVALIFLITMVYSLILRSGFMLFASFFGLLFALLSTSNDELVFSSAFCTFSILFLFLFPQKIEQRLSLLVEFLSIVTTPIVLFTYRKKLSVFKLSVLSVFLTIVGYYSFSKADVYVFGVERLTILGLIMFMFYFAVLGMVAQTFQRIIVYSSAVQFLFAILDFEIGKLSGETALQTLRIVEYLVACIPFFTVLIIASREGSYKGILRENNLLGISFLVACLAMAGVPGFSIFVSEFALLSASMQVNKLLMMIIVFFVTLCFILYASYLFPALLPGKKKFETNKLVVWLCLVSALLTIVMGLSPLLQEGIVKVFTW